MVYLYDATVKTLEVGARSRNGGEGGGGVAFQCSPLLYKGFKGRAFQCSPSMYRGF